ncbi:carboxypeptidase-like regulatory domain-containing protein [uncultured Draconibacterium sp.]|uniref:carboxypeptidase-like regulatory domain-containing protein n=1 Tax=uncultured Draconibacterium sp. TaxID=1573823 RepID=UPI0025E0BC5F|nr:carboxypeptidase-like regulatory domain-containing protein [uncultured Draconibacterium sp.]
MILNRWFLFVFSVFITINSAQAQQIILEGRVTHAQTQEPIPHTEVFISGTTIGCISDSLGNFSLKAPFFPCVLVADHVAFDAHIKTLKESSKLHIQLHPSNYNISGVNVSGKNKRKRNLRFFYSHFIRQYRDKIEVLNDSNLVFNRDEMQFLASSKNALLIENNYLGYRIKLVLQEFSVKMYDGPEGQQIPLKSLDGGEVMKLKGYFYYEPLDKEQPHKADYFNHNRRITYHGSYRHFLKSIYDNNPGAEGYKIKVYPETEAAAFYELENNELSTPAKEFAIQAQKLEVFYRFDDDLFPIPEEFLTDRYYFSQKKSVIYPSRQSFTIRPNGTSPNVNFIIDGYMDMKNFANSLPEDYTPPQN